MATGIPGLAVISPCLYIREYIYDVGVDICRAAMQGLADVYFSSIIIILGQQRRRISAEQSGSRRVFG
jgi:hypothetical protein